MSFEKLENEAIKENLIKVFNPNIDLLKNFKDWTEYKAISEIPTLNNATIELKKSEESFHFKCNKLSSSNDTIAKYKEKGFGFYMNFLLSNSKFKIIVPIGVRLMNMTLSNDGINFSGNIEFLHSKYFKSEPNYYRAIIPIKFNPSENIANYICTKPFKIDEYLSHFGMVRLIDFDLFEYNYEDQSYLVIDSRKINTFEEFENSLGKVIHSYAFVTGSLYRSETYFFSSPKATFEDATEFGYKVNKRTIKSKSTVIPYRFLRETNQNNKFGETRLEIKYFESIFNKVFNQTELFRCIKLMAEAGDLPLELKTSIYSVCLETMRNLIKDTQKNKTKPFKEKKHSREFINSSKAILNEIPIEVFNNKESIIKRLENINQPGNTESFMEVFKIQGIELTKDDINALKMRNDFLHGRIVFDTSENYSELKYISDKLFQLISYLILKYCGYSGFVLNQATLRLLLNNKPLEKEKYLLRRI